MALEGNSVVPIVKLTDLERYDQKREERAVRRQQREIGTPFRPYDLFDQGLVIPEVLIANRDLSPGEKLTWMALASALGKSGDCYPSCATLGRKLGVDDLCQRCLVNIHSVGAAAIVMPRPDTPGKLRTNGQSEDRFVWEQLARA